MAETRSTLDFRSGAVGCGQMPRRLCPTTINAPRKNNRPNEQNVEGQSGGPGDKTEFHVTSSNVRDNVNKYITIFFSSPNVHHSLTD